VKTVAPEMVDRCPSHVLNPDHYLDGDICLHTAAADARSLAIYLAGASSAARDIRDRLDAAAARGLREDDVAVIKARHDEMREHLANAGNERALVAHAVSNLGR